MIDPVTAVLGIPPALEAALQLITRVRKALSSLPSDTHDEEAAVADIEANIRSVQDRLLDFTAFTELLRSWKQAHHITQLVMTELSSTFRFFQGGRTTFIDRITHDRDVFRDELDTMQRPTGSLTQLMTVDDPALFQLGDLPSALDLAGCTWNTHLLALCSDAKDALEAHDLNLYYNHIGKVRLFLHPSQWASRHKTA
jgi:hypothetical protein